jgi:hypothetical protein
MCSEQASMLFFCETLSVAYVPPAQNALALEGWHSGEWAATDSAGVRARSWPNCTWHGSRKL